MVGDRTSTYADTWVPVGANLALGRIALQSSQDPALPAEPHRAIDGKTDGIYANRSVAHTNTGTAPNTSYWEVDLGGVQWIDGLQLWARADAGLTDRLKNFYVFTADKAFISTDVSTVVNSGVWKKFVSGLAGRPSVIPVQKYARYVRVQLYGPNPAPAAPSDNNYLDLAELEVYGRPGTPDQWPMAVTAGSSPLPASSFTLTWRDGRTQTLQRPLNLLWTGAPFITGRGSDDVGFLTGVGGNRQAVQGSGNSKEWTVGLEIKKKRELSVGTSQRQSVSNAWGQGVEFEGKAQGMGANAPTTLDYQWKPYMWLQQAVPAEGGSQEFLVLDYAVPTANAITPLAMPDLCPGIVDRALGGESLAPPQAPLITSPTHPDENTWYTGNTVTFNWQQPAGDIATVKTYDYVLDRQANTVPLGFHLGITPTVTYEGLNDGVWYLHVRPIGGQEDLGGTGHRKVQVDAQPPQVSLALDPPGPTGKGEWYTTPVTVIVSATDPLGSGVASVEVSADGVTWAPYAAPWVFSADTPGTTVYARATDAVGHVSVPVSMSFKIDRTSPNSHVTGGDGPGAWLTRVLTNTIGNQVLVLAGAIADAGSGQAGMVLEQDGFYWNASASLAPGIPCLIPPSR